MTRHWLAALALGVVIAAGAATSCSSGDDDGRKSVTRIPEPDDVPESKISESLMLALGQAKNFHHKANVYLQDGNVDAAIAAVREILSIEWPAGAPEAQDVMFDARARLGKLLLGAGQYEEALRVVDEGIASATRDSYFLANLYTVRGEILEAAAPNETDPEAAKKMRHDAIEALDRSTAMQLAIQRQLAKEMGL
jgi:tetratricopeptide (TPR) repeat protein